MKIALGADHGGFSLKSELTSFLMAEGHKAMDFGTMSTEPCDYPVFAYKVAKAVSEGKADAGVLICKSGNGMAMVANKLPNVRAAICFDKDVATLSRQHNNANILVLGSEHLFDEPETIVRAWLATPFEGGRHKRRVDLIAGIEKRIGAPAKSPSRPAKNTKKGRK
ncbi:MAG: Ribose-5-phosphate isomerase B [Candidatus Omnitrophica bacterium]|nr:Ribose-5-phosphate isomerase B [Candidatus Omnitrophota bacterium]